MPLSPRTLRPANNFTPRSIPGLALWLDASSADTLYTTDAGPVTAVSSPTDIAGCALWLDGADASASSMTLNGSLVETWKDKSGGGRDFTAASTARPTLTPSAINSRSAVTFNGSSTTMTGNTAAQDVIRNLAGYTVFAALRTATVAAGERLAFGVGSTVLFRIGQQDSRTFAGGRRVTGDTLESITGTAGDLSAGTGFIQTAVVNHTAQSLTGLRNGAAFASDTTYMGAGSSENVASSVSVGTQAGGTYGFWNGDVAEIIVYNTTLTTAQRASVEAYLATKWGISGVHAPATATSDPVGYWGDKSGNARHATQSTSANRPLVGAAVANGRRGVNFGTAGNSQRLGWLPSSGTQDWRELIAVGVYDLSASTFADLATVFSGYNTNAGTALGIGVSGEGGSNAISLTYGSFLPESNINATQHVAGTLVRPFPAITSPFVIIGRSTTANAVAGYVVGNDRQFSSGRNWRGRLSEVIAFERALTLAERSKLFRYLAAKYGITLAPQVSNADAQDWINRVYANGGTVSASTAAAVNTLCDSLDAASLRDRFYRMGIFAGSNLNAALVPLYRGPSLGGTQYGNATDTNNAFVGVGTDYAETGASGGLTGNGTSKYLNTGVPGNAMAVGNRHLSAYEIARDAGDYRALIGTQDNGGGAYFYALENLSPGTTLTFHCGPQANLTSQSSGAHWTGSDQAANAMSLYKNGTSAATSSGTSKNPPSVQPILVFALNQVPGSVSPAAYSSSRLGGYSVGLSLSGSQAAAYYTAMQAFQTALGRNA